MEVELAEDVDDTDTVFSQIVPVVCQKVVEKGALCRSFDEKDSVGKKKAKPVRLRAEDIRNRKKRENHAKIVIGVAIIHQCQTSEASATRFRTVLEEFYADSPERLQAAHYGLTLTVKKPSSDADQD